jgi:hypothetical protein
MTTPFMSESLSRVPKIRNLVTSGHLWFVSSAGGGRLKTCL